MSEVAAPPAKLTRSWWFTQPMMRGDEVFWAQRLLNDRAGAALKPDGLFGAATRQAVMAFQRRRGLVEDGVLGPVTWAALSGEGRPGAALKIGVESILDADALAVLGKAHSRYPDGVLWRLTRSGLEVDGALVEPSAAEADLAMRVLVDYDDAIATASARFPVPAELVVATICTESSGDPRAKRFEPGCDLEDPSRTPRRVSVGLMQTLLSTAREALGEETLSLSALENPSTSVRAGMAYMWRQAGATHFDPPLVACAYNAGSVRYQGSAGNRWKLAQYPIGTGKHADRFVRFFNAAMAAIATRGTDALPSPAVCFVGLLKR
ncbi:peptidoglycan-binding protein [Falsiroseomonas bella]|uniref:peptidoglycan-binding protein n=1 Tax=Falsiroseomonas bella TaxID=2184016 RepID=UPI001304FC1A|nr:peptidoglycan-binding protein [Falsiroseomonas bella]